MAPRKKAAAATTPPAEVGGVAGVTPSIIVPRPSRALTAATQFAGYNILDSLNDVVVANEILASVQSRQKGSMRPWQTMAQQHRAYIPLRHMYLQYMFQTYGIPYPGGISIIGDTGVGKTSFVMRLLAECITYGSPICYIETESKLIDKERMAHFLGTTDIRLAARMLNAISWKQAHTLDEMEGQMNDWLDVQRGRKSAGGHLISVPMEMPLVVVIDTWSKLMSTREAEGFYDPTVLRDAPPVEDADFGMVKKTKGKAKTAAGKAPKAAKEERKSIDDIVRKTTDHAVWAQAWARRLAGQLDTHNFVLILVEHQNDDFDMNAMPSYLPAQYKKLQNARKRGGRGLNQLMQMIMVLAKESAVRQGTKVIGHRVGGKIHKNSYGLEHSKIGFELITDLREARSAGILAPGISFDTDLCNLFAERKLFGTTVTNSTSFSSSHFGLDQVAAAELSRAFHDDPAARELFGKENDIRGYQDFVDDILYQIAQNPPTEE